MEPFKMLCLHILYLIIVIHKIFILQLQKNKIIISYLYPSGIYLILWRDNFRGSGIIDTTGQIVKNATLFQCFASIQHVCYWKELMDWDDISGLTLWRLNMLGVRWVCGRCTNCNTVSTSVVYLREYAGIQGIPHLFFWGL